MIGETIKEFRLTQRLGRGGMGEVWAAEQQIIKTKVAIKLLLEEISTDKQHVQRFFNEAIAVGKIKHSGIAKIFDVGFHAGRAFLIMELLEGETLASRIARAGRLPLGQIADVGRQIASILAATHAEGITHRDLKPDNIFLVPDAELESKERVKILDFGIAKLHGGTGTGMTATGGTMGTPAYMAPEQWNDAAKADARADVYSLGCLTFEMCCGRTPFVVTSVGEACTKHLTVTPPRASSVVPELPGALDDAIARMLAKEPAERPAMRELGGMFAAIAAVAPRALDPTMLPAPQLAQPVSVDVVRPSAPETTLGSAASSRATTRGPSKAKYAALAAGGIVVAGGVIGFVATRDRGRASEPEHTAVPVPPVDAAASEPRKPAANAWIRIDVPPKPYVLGVEDKAPDEHVGFRAARRIVTPSEPFEIQQHEVTWGELDPWLASKQVAVVSPAWAKDAASRATLPATGITWTDASAYCGSIGGSLPTEEQWEYAARGPDRRPNPWGAELLDRQMTHAFAGEDAVPAPVMTSQQDRIRHAGGQVDDLAGNVQEWTLGLWREDRPGKEASSQSGHTSVRAIRGFPLAAPATTAVQPDAAAYRERLCATGPCVEKTRTLLARIGFRCVRSVAK